MNPIFSPATLKTILNNAPLIIQGAGKLIRIIKERENKPETEQDLPVTMESLNEKIESLQQRLDANAQSDVEQIKLIEELAKQNESLADSLNRTYARLNIFSLVAILALIIALIGIGLALAR